MYYLEEDGFQVFKEILPKDFCGSIDVSLESLKNSSNKDDVFMTSHGPKQIQHLESREDYQAFARYLMFITGRHGKVLNMMMFVKYPGYKITAPHQDGAYFENPNKTIITFWVPIQDVDEKNSCMHYIPGSHKQGLIPHSNVGSVVRNRTGKTGLSLSSGKITKDYVPVPMKIGDVLIHDQFCLHYSTSNFTNIPRLAVTCIIEIENGKRNISS